MAEKTIMVKMNGKKGTEITGKFDKWFWPSVSVAVKSSTLCLQHAAQ